MDRFLRDTFFQALELAENVIDNPVQEFEHLKAKPLEEICKLFVERKYKLSGSACLALQRFNTKALKMIKSGRQVDNTFYYELVDTCANIIACSCGIFYGSHKKNRFNDKDLQD